MGDEKNKARADDRQDRDRQTKRPDGDRETDRDMGSALRSIYQRAVEEKIPDEMLDLLGKLG